ncbi:unnamed protein product, partial [Rotaria magnacalcarata]
MNSTKRLYPNQPTHWNECAEQFEEDSDDEGGDMT